MRPDRIVVRILANHCSQLSLTGHSAQNPNGSLKQFAFPETIRPWSTPAAWEAVAMGKHRMKPNYRRRVPRLPDLDPCKIAVLNSLGSPASRGVYEHAIDQFII